MGKGEKGMRELIIDYLFDQYLTRGYIAVREDSLGEVIVKTFLPTWRCTRLHMKGGGVYLLFSPPQVDVEIF